MSKPLKISGLQRAFAREVIQVTMGDQCVQQQLQAQLLEQSEALESLAALLAAEPNEQLQQVSRQPLGPTCPAAEPFAYSCFSCASIYCLADFCYCAAAR